jgi:hypothetical protein
MNKIVVRGRVRIQPYILAELGERVDDVCASRGVTESAIVEAALRQYLDGTSDKTLLLRRLDRLGRAVERDHRDLEILTETFAVFMRLWFAHTPTIPEDAKQAARMTAEARYRQFVKHVAEQFSGGRRFLDDLPREDLSDDAELDDTAARGASDARAESKVENRAAG